MVLGNVRRKIGSKKKTTKKQNQKTLSEKKTATLINKVAISALLPSCEMM